MNCFEINNLDIFYDDFHAVKNVTMDIPENQVVSLIGPSGCGKSTFLKSLNRLNELVEGCRVDGSIKLFGQDIQKEIEVTQLRTRVGMVFQKANPFPMSVYENIAFGPRTNGIKDKQELDNIIEEALRDATIWNELKDRLNKSALGLSGGQQQRLCIARTLAVKPDVLLLDEPTSALDPISTAKIEELLLILREKYSIIIVTHNMQQAARISDRTAFFLIGECIEYGKAVNMFARPKDKRTEDYFTGRFG